MNKYVVARRDPSKPANPPDEWRRTNDGLIIGPAFQLDTMAQFAIVESNEGTRWYAVTDEVFNSHAEASRHMAGLFPERYLGRERYEILRDFRIMAIDARHLPQSPQNLGAMKRFMRSLARVLKQKP